FVFYVGKGTGVRETRHLSWAQQCLALPATKEDFANPRLINHIRKLLLANAEPEIFRVADNLNEQRALSLEHKLIVRIGRIEDGGTLLNLLDGRGPGTAGYHWTEEQSKAQRETLNSYWSTPEGVADKARRSEYLNKLYQTPEGDRIRDQIRDSLSGPNHPFYGTQRPEETCTAIGNGNRGKVHPLELREQTQLGVMTSNELKKMGYVCSTCQYWHEHPQCQDTKATSRCKYYERNPNMELVPQDLVPAATRETLREAARRRWTATIRDIL
ncbi:MAG: hypothetical protein WC895_04995, partial [Candidatus Shapirobacteria bacterium]